MTALTTRQRDLLRLLIDAETPLATADVAKQLQLTPRQVNYSLKGVQGWLKQNAVELAITPGVGAQLLLSDAQETHLQDLLESDDSYQLVMSPHQRQQLFLFLLLTTAEPLILYQLQQWSQVSRTTILKDLDSAEPWLDRFDLTLERRPNYGIEIAGTEKKLRQAFVALLWGDATLGEPLWGMSHTTGLNFALRSDSALLPILSMVRERVEEIEARATITSVAQAEALLGGRFSDVTVLHLALSLAVQRYRVGQGFGVATDSAETATLRSHPIWPTALRIASSQLRAQSKEQCEAEVAQIAAHLLGGSRNDRWPGDVESESAFSSLIGTIMQTISRAYQLPDLMRDTTLRDGLIAHVIPACLRQRYDLWAPVQYSNRLQQTYKFELNLADQLNELIAQETGTLLPENEVNNLALLIRAAYVRERPNHLQHVVVVCPSGMATAQLLTARLKARFPRLGTIQVLSMRELADGLDSAELILTTVPLPEHLIEGIKVIQLHPLLLPEDIETITEWLAH